MIHNNPPPLFARRTDPATIHEAGRIATEKHPDSEAATWVLQVLDCGQTLNDEEIVDRAQRDYGCPLSPQRLRAGRKYAADRGMIVNVGKVPLKSGSPGRTWRKS